MADLWICSCGFETENAVEAFLHRDGTDFHHVTPHRPRSPLTGIDKAKLQQEIELAAKGKV